MNRAYLLDSLDGLKALVFSLLPPDVVGSIACVPMTTDGPWTAAERAIFERAIGIPSDRTFWTPGGFANVPPSTDRDARGSWVEAVGAIDHRYLFLDPDKGFYTHHNGGSEKKVLINELGTMLRGREAVIVYRHQYWPKPRPTNVPKHTYPYVWHGLRMLADAGLAGFAYQSQVASCFFVATNRARIEPFRAGLETAFAGVSDEVRARRLVG